MVEMSEQPFEEFFVDVARRPVCLFWRALGNTYALKPARCSFVSRLLHLQYDDGPDSVLLLSIVLSFFLATDNTHTQERATYKPVF